VNPYRRKITVGKDGLSDIYDVLTAFNVTCPATQHAVKKLLIPGVRTGGKSRVQDLEEAVQAAQRAVELAGDAPGIVLPEVPPAGMHLSSEFNCPPKTPAVFSQFPSPRIGIFPPCSNCGSTNRCRCL
jgi:hypothetical protein